MSLNLNLQAFLSRAQNITDISTEADLETALIRLRRVLTENTQLRNKHPSTPALFLQSELHLHAALQSLSSIAVYPSLHPSLIAHGALSHFIQLLAHPNDDMLCDVISLLHDLSVDVDNELMRNFIQEAFLSHGILKAIANSLPRLSGESTDNDDQVTFAEALARALGIFEDIVDAKTTLAFRLVNDTGIMEACIPMVKAQRQQPVEAAAELLAVLMQQDIQVRELFIDYGGLRVVLDTVDKLKGGVETVRNLMDVVCCLLLTQKGKQQFVDEGGVEIVLNIIRRSKKYREAALRVLDFGCVDNARAVGIIFESRGVGILFAVLGRLEEEGGSEGEVRRMTEHLVGLLLSLLRYGDGEQRERVMMKMKEGGKVLMIVRIYVWFRDGTGGGVLDELEEGSLVLQMGAVVLGYVMAEGGQALRDGVIKVLKEMNVGLEEIFRRCDEYVEGIEEREDRDREHSRIRWLVEQTKRQTEEEYGEGR